MSYSAAHPCFRTRYVPRKTCLSNADAVIATQCLYRLQLTSR